MNDPRMGKSIDGDQIDQDVLMEIIDLMDQMQADKGMSMKKPMAMKMEIESKEPTDNPVEEGQEAADEDMGNDGMGGQRSALEEAMDQIDDDDSMMKMRR